MTRLDKNGMLDVLDTVMAQPDKVMGWTAYMKGNHALATYQVAFATGGFGGELVRLAEENGQNGGGLRLKEDESQAWTGGKAGVIPPTHAVILHLREGEKPIDAICALRDFVAEQIVTPAIVSEGAVEFDEQRRRRGHG